MSWLGPLLKLLTWLGQTLFAWKAGKDSVKAQAAENSLEQISKAHAPLSDPELQRVRERWRRD